jgi:uncharacterized protein (TIGR00290 family)
MKPKALLSWSSGKDSAWAFHRLRQEQEVEIIGLVTTLNESFHRVAMHGVRWELVEAQAKSIGLPLWPVLLPWPCSNAEYEARMQEVIQKARSAEVSIFAFGDLFLEEIRAYRERQLAGTGIQPIFPLWGTLMNTPKLAQEMIGSGLRATLTCVDPRQLDPSFVGSEFDSTFLEQLPSVVDPCGERGEFHTFCYDGPMFHQPISIQKGEIVERDGFWFIDLQSSKSVVRSLATSLREEKDVSKGLETG